VTIAPAAAKELHESSTLRKRVRQQSVASGENVEIVSSAERESQQARAQQHKAGRCQREESIGNQIVIVHDKPACEILVRIDLRVPKRRLRR
jgi:hypothetical protein